jgi:chemotaxis protein CheD
VREYLRDERVRVVAEDVGDIHPRMVVYFPASGEAKVKRLRSLHNNLIAIKEGSYINKVVGKPLSGDIELF